MADHSPLDGVQELARLARVLSMFGVVGGTETLTEDLVRPEKCMRRAQRSLHFMGFGAGKWRSEPWFREELERISRREGEVRFLIAQVIDQRALDALATLQTEFPNTLQVRLMEGRSLFRIVIVDRRQLIVSHYGHEVILGNGQNAQGWQSPQLIVEDGAEWSLLTPFMILYNDVWERSVPLNGDDSSPQRSHRSFE
ncbi:hypothetical protein ACIQSP_09785 [Streptomyces nigra]|uniref:hypothetical protein n=1 Tax=Streptomyces nigra TaxID=1827580 RepID=UPI0038300D19